MVDVTLGVFAGLLLPTGWAKVRRPAETVKALQSVGWPSHRRLVVGLGLVELATGTAVLATGAAAAVVSLGLLYLGFLLWLLVAFRAGGVVASCGCAGTPDTPPTGAHLMINLAAAAAVGADLVSSSPGVTYPSEPLGGLAAGLVTGVGVWLAFLTITDGARLSGLLRS